VATTVERLGIVETKVENLDCKLDELKSDVKELHDCLDRTGDSLHAALKEMTKNSSEAHDDLAKKISDLEKFKTKWTYLIMGGVAVLGWIGGHATALTTFIK
jgi:chromosome condensin MukBEF complex kleisin-like MukF subunit